MVQVQRKAMAENRGENTILKIAKICRIMQEAGGGGKTHKTLLALLE